MRKDTSRRQNPVVVEKPYKLIKEKKTPTHVKDNLTAIVKEREDLVNRSVSSITDFLSLNPTVGTLALKNKCLLPSSCQSQPNIGKEAGGRQRD